MSIKDIFLTYVQNIFNKISERFNTLIEINTIQIMAIGIMLDNLSLMPG